MPNPPPIDPDEHLRHVDDAAYQAAIERAAIQETNETTKEIEERTVKDERVQG